MLSIYSLLYLSFYCTGFVALNSFGSSDVLNQKSLLSSLSRSLSLSLFPKYFCPTNENDFTSH